jgi:tetratricopeptide (TPR) repeat protein
MNKTFTNKNGWWNNYGISPEVFADYAGKLAVTEAALASFLRIAQKLEISQDSLKFCSTDPKIDWEGVLHEMAAMHKELLLRLETVQSATSQEAWLKKEARQAVNAGDYIKAEVLLEYAVKESVKERSSSAAMICTELVLLQRVQLNYDKAAEYWQKAATLTPEDQKKERSLYLHNAGTDLLRVSPRQAMSLYEQSLAIRQEIGDRAGEGATLHQIAMIYALMQQHDAALKYYEQSLAIRQEIGDRAGEVATLHNIGQIYYDRSIGHDHRDHAAALKHLEQSLCICQEIGERKNEVKLLNDISQIYHDRRDHAAALKHLEQSLRICQEIGDKDGELATSWKIGRAYAAQGDTTKANLYFSRAMQLREEIVWLRHPTLEYFCRRLEEIHAMRKG